MPPRQKTLTIQTPEGITFPLAIADPVSRFLALMIDQVCVYLLSSLIGGLFAVIGFISWDFAGAFMMLSSLVVTVAYPMTLEWGWRGQTIGKKVLRLQVMDVQGLRLQFSQIVIRNLLRFVDFLPAFYLVGGVSSLLNARGQRLGDIAANTIVIQHPRVREPDLDQVLPGKYNSFRAYPHLAARQRQNTSPQEAGIALQALIRRDALDANARLALFAGIRQRMEQIVKYPPEATEGISDEQYIRNVVDVLFR